MLVLEAGNYIGKIFDYGIKTTKEGLAAPTIAFIVSDSSGTQVKVFWQGTFKEGRGQEICLETLLRCGLSDPSDLKNLGQGRKSGILDIEKEFDLAIIKEKNNEGKPFNKVDWVNEAGFRNQVKANDAATMVAGLNLEGPLMAIAAAKGYTLKTAGRRPSSSNPHMTPDALAALDELPF